MGRVAVLSPVHHLPTGSHTRHGTYSPGRSQPPGPSPVAHSPPSLQASLPPHRLDPHLPTSPSSQQSTHAVHAMSPPTPVALVPHHRPLCGHTNPPTSTTHPPPSGPASVRY